MERAAGTDRSGGYATGAGGAKPGVGLLACRTPTPGIPAGVGTLVVTPPVPRRRHLSELTNIVAFLLAVAN